MEIKRHGFGITFVALVLLASAAFTQQVRAAAITTDTIGTFIFSQNLQLWERGEDIRSLQKLLNAHGYFVAQSGTGSPGNESTLFGHGTYRALIKYQAARGLPPTGFFGPLTRAVISAPSSGVAPSAIGSTGSAQGGTSQKPQPNTPSTSQPAAPLSTLFRYPNFPGYGGGGGDTTPPVISGMPSNITAEATSGSGATVIYTSPTATDNVDGTVGVSCSPASGSSFAFGTTAVTCSATDKAGNSSNSSFNVTVHDTTAPSVSLTAPSNGTTVSGSSVTLSATASDTVGVVGVQFNVDGSNVGAEDTSSPYSITWGSTSIADGSHAVVAVARDAAGNHATSTSITITVDNTAPVRSGGSPSGTLALNTTATTISLTTNEAATCKYTTSAGVAYGSMTAFTTTVGTSHSSSVSGLSNGGSYIYYIKCQDAHSNTNATDYTISFTVAADTTSPTVNVAAPANNAVLKGSSVTVSANATDDVSVAGVQFKLDTNTNIGAEQTSAPYAVTWNSTGVADGTHTIIAVARDGSGNYATSSVITVMVDNDAPTVSMTAPSNGATVSGSLVTLSANASDVGGVAGVQFKVNGVSVGSEDTSSPYSIAWDSTATSSGSKSIVAVARDAAGNYATSTAVTVTVDNTAPVISSVSSGTLTTTSATITWTTDENSDSQINYGSTSAYGASTTLDSTLVTSHSVVLSGLTANTVYHFRVRSTDGQGNLAVSNDQTFMTASVGQVATRSYIPTTSTAGLQQMMARSHHVAMDNIASLQLVLIGEANASDTASIEYPASKFTQVKFSGSATGTVPSGGILVSDSVSVTIPKGSTFYVRRYHIAPTNVGVYTPIVDRPGGDAMQYGASGVPDMTMGGTIGNSGGTAGLFPAAIVAVTSLPSVCIVGDSRAMGQADTPGDTGEIAKWIAPSFAYINEGIPSDKAQNYTTNRTQEITLTNNYCSDVISNYGINDLGAAHTAAQLTAEHSINPNCIFHKAVLAGNYLSKNYVYRQLGHPRQSNRCII